MRSDTGFILDILKINNMQIKWSWVVSDGNRYCIIFVTLNGWYFKTLEGGNLQQIDEDTAQDMKNNSKFALNVDNQDKAEGSNK